MRYQLRYIRVLPGFPGRLNDFSPLIWNCKTGRAPRVSRPPIRSGSPHRVASILGSPGVLGDWRSW